MPPFVDAHSHVTPLVFPVAPNDAARSRWPCMRCEPAGEATVMIGETAFRSLDTRSWDVARRIEDMDRDGVAMQVLSPMPELLSYWMAPRDAALVCDVSNGQIAEMVARAPRRFRGLGAVPMQDPDIAAAALPRIKRDFGLSGVEIGSNIDGTMLGDPRFDPFWAAAESEGMAVFVHALHPVAAKPIDVTPIYTAMALFPIDVAMAAASLMMAGIIDRHPGLRIGFSHGGGALGAILGRLDMGWDKTGGFKGQAVRRPSEQARSFFYDSNVYDAAYLRHLAAHIAPGCVFGGTDYPYEIMQTDPVSFIRSAISDAAIFEEIAIDAASRFLNEHLRDVVAVSPGVGARLEDKPNISRMIAQQDRYPVEQGEISMASQAPLHPNSASDMPVTQFVESTAGRIAYQEAGSGPVVILIHGGGPGAYGYSNYRKNLLPIAEAGNRVVIVDLPGYGQSEFRENVGGLFDAPARAILELIDHLGVEKASLVGNSLGGGTALRVAIDHPGRVNRLILMGPGGSLPATSTFPSEGLLRMLTFYDGEGPTLEKLERVIDLLVFDRSSITPELVRERFETATLPQTMANPPLKGAAADPRNELWRESLEKVTHPTLMIWGRDDKVLPLDMAFIYLRRLPNADLHVFSKCGHWAQWERADEFNELVINFLVG